MRVLSVKHRRIFAGIAIVILLIGFGVWAKLMNLNTVAAVGGNVQNTNFFNSKGPEKFTSVDWEHDLYNQSYVEKIIMYKNKLVTISKNFICCTDGNTGKELWRYERKNDIVRSVGINGFSTAVCYNGVVYFVKGSEVFGLVLEDGKEKWSFVDEEGYDISEILIQNGVLYYSSINGYMHSINIKNKKENWKQHMGTASSVAFDKGVLYINDFRNITAISAADGKLKWKVKAEHFGPITVGEKCLFAVNTIYYASNDGSSEGLVAFDKKDGTRLWSYKKENMINDKLVYHEGKLYFVSENYNDAGADGVSKNYVKALDEETGNQLWSLEGDTIYSDLSVSKNGLYVSGRGKLFKINLVNGTIESSLDVEYNQVFAPITWEGNLYLIGNKSREAVGQWFLIKVK